MVSGLLAFGASLGACAAAPITQLLLRGLGLTPLAGKVLLDMSCRARCCWRDACSARDGRAVFDIGLAHAHFGCTTCVLHTLLQQPACHFPCPCFFYYVHQVTYFFSRTSRTVSPSFTTTGMPHSPGKCCTTPWAAASYNVFFHGAAGHRWTASWNRMCQRCSCLMVRSCAPALICIWGARCSQAPAVSP